MKTIKIISKSLLPGLTIHSYFRVYKYAGYIIINCSNTGLLWTTARPHNVSLASGWEHSCERHPHQGSNPSCTLNSHVTFGKKQGDAGISALYRERINKYLPYNSLGQISSEQFLIDCLAYTASGKSKLQTFLSLWVAVMSHIRAVTCMLVSRSSQIFYLIWVSGSSISPKRYCPPFIFFVNRWGNWGSRSQSLESSSRPLFAQVSTDPQKTSCAMPELNKIKFPLKKTPLFIL